MTMTTTMTTTMTPTTIALDKATLVLNSEFGMGHIYPTLKLHTCQL